MSAPLTTSLTFAASLTSSGFTDGLGRRSLAFDREEGTMLERLTLRPELAAFASMLRERVERLSALEDERIARPRGIERDPAGGLVVVSEFVPGNRLSDLLDNTAEQGTAPGLDAAFGYMLDVLPALCGLHAGAGFPHGSITPSRTVLTPAGQVVLLDGIYGGALSLLRYSSKKLWTEFGVAVPPGLNGAAHLGVEADIAQVALSSVMLILGRPLYEDEFPDALPRVITDAIDIAHIRGSSQFARGFRSFLDRALPFSTGRPYPTADDALIDLRGLAAELGPDACRRALVDFIEQAEPPAQAQLPVPTDVDDDVLAAISSFGVIDSLEVVDTGDEFDDLTFEDDAEDEEELDLDVLAADADPDLNEAAAAQPSAAPWTAPQTASDWTDDSEGGRIATTFNETSLATSVSSTALSAGLSAERHPQPTDATKAEKVILPASVAEPPPVDMSERPAATTVRSKRAKRTRSARARKDRLRSAAAPTPLATQTTASPANRITPLRAEPPTEKQPKQTPDKVEPVEKVAAAASTEKADQPEKTDAAPETEKWAAGNWLVTPGRADSFAPPAAPEPRSVPLAPRPIAPVMTLPSPAPGSAVPIIPANVSMAPPAGVPLAPPAPFASISPALSSPAPITLMPPPPAVATRVQVPTFGAPGGWTPQLSTPAPPAQALPVPPTTSASPQVTPVKLKTPVAKPRAARPSPSPAEDIYGTPSASAPRERSAFPWRLAVGAVAATIVLIIGGRAYLPATAGAEKEAPAATAPAEREADTPTRTRAAAPGAAKSSAAPSPVASTGRIEIETQPAGVQVQLDGKSVGLSPLTLESVPVGRHAVTLTSPSGSVKRMIRVEGGRTIKVDVPIFSGWVGIFAPFVVEVSEAGRVIGTTEESRLMLSPGPHVLTLTNRDLGYRSIEKVEIEPGEVRSVTLDPRGTVNLNATPWAEVWVNGKKAGDTPLAGLQLPLGIQEITFRHPELGERKVSVTVKGDQPAALSVTMTK